MVTWKDFESIEMKKRAGANAVPMAVGYQNNGMAYTIPDPEAFTGPRMIPYGTRVRMGRRPLMPDVAQRIAGVFEGKDGKSWLGKKVYSLDDEAKRYPGEESDPYYHNILVGGSLAAGKGFRGWSAMPFGVLSKGVNKELFRNGEIEKIKAAIERARKEGKHVRVVGHSWGGADVANLASEYPDIPFVAIDPTSWTRVLKRLPGNLTVLRPDGSTDGIDASRGAQVFGHQWPMITEGEGRTIVYPGDHVTGAGHALTRLHNEVRDQRLEAERRAAAQKLEEGRKAELLRGVAMRPEVKKETP